MIHPLGLEARYIILSTKRAYPFHGELVTIVPLGPRPALLHDCVESYASAEQTISLDEDCPLLFN